MRLAHNVTQCCVYFPDHTEGNCQLRHIKKDWIDELLASSSVIRAHFMRIKCG